MPVASPNKRTTAVEKAAIAADRATQKANACVLSKCVPKSKRLAEISAGGKLCGSDLAMTNYSKFLAHCAYGTCGKELKSNAAASKKFTETKARRAARVGAKK